MSKLEYVQLETGTQCNAAVIWLHGLGADGHDFEPIVPELHLPKDASIRFIFPHAPMRPVSLNAGAVMRAWFDIAALEMSAKPDIQGIMEAEMMVNELVTEQYRSGIAYERIVLAGFSQGGAVALLTGLRSSHKLAGIIALSTYLPNILASQNVPYQHNKQTPIFMAHGLYDPLVTFSNGQATKEMLITHGYKVSWHTYAMAHSVCGEEIVNISDWLRVVLSL